MTIIYFFLINFFGLMDKAKQYAMLAPEYFTCGVMAGYETVNFMKGEVKFKSYCDLQIINKSIFYSSSFEIVFTGL